MDNGKALLKFDPSNLKVNGANYEDSDVDEDAIEDQKRSEEILRKQFEHFDDGSDEESARSVSSTSSRSDAESNPEANQILNHHFTNGIILNRLSDISEHSLNNSLQNTSKDSGTTSPTKSLRLQFSPANQFHNKNYSPGTKGKGDYKNYKPILENSPKILTSLTHQTIFSVADSNNHSEHSVNNSEVFNPGVFDGRGDENYQPIFNNNSSLERSDNGTPSSLQTSNYLSQNFEHNSAEAYRHADMNSMQELQVLYEVRLRENKQLVDQLQAERQEKSNMFRKMTLLDADKERALLSRTEADKLLVKNKEEISNLQQEVDSLKQKLLTLEEEKNKNEELLLMSKMQSQDLEHRINLMERCDPNKSYVKLTDIKLQEMKNSHKKEILLMQNEIDKLNKKLAEKDESCLHLEKKLSELQRSYEALLVDRSETINQLAQRLEDSQAQCQKLMAANVSIDNIRLQAQLDEANKEREQLNQTVRDLQVECQMMKSDLAQYESVSRLNLPNSQSSSDETDSVVLLGISHSKRSKHDSNLNSSDINSKLKEELHRALMNQKAKRAEISRLKQIICDKEEQITEMTYQERIFASETEKLSDQLNKLTAELTFYQERNKEDSYQNDHQGEIDDKIKQISELNSELSQLRQDKQLLEKEKSEIQHKFDHLSKRFQDEKRKDIQNHDKEYLKFHDETVAKLRKDLEEESEMKIKEYRIRLDQSLKEVSELKLMYVSVCEAKEQINQSLKEVTSKLEKVNNEKEKIAAELKENISIRDQLAKKLNVSHSNTKKDNYLEEKLIEERDKLKVDHDKCAEIKNQLAQMVDSIKSENEELKEKVQKLNQMMNSSPKSLENQLSEECERLREELASVSTRHTLELSAVRTELQNARDRVVQLEKSTRQQFETELKNLRQDRDMLKTKCDEKEVQIKKLIDSRKRPPPIVHSYTQTDILIQDLTEVGTDLQKLEERHRLELARCTEEYDGMLAVVEGTHQQTLEQLKKSHQLILEDIMHKVEQREADLLAAHKQELQLIEERTKQVTVKYFAEEVKKLEAKYKDEANHKVDSSVINTLHQSLIEKSKEVESLKHQFAVLNEEWKQQLTNLRNQADSEKENTAQMMVQWAKELKNMEGELKLKEALIDEQREKLEKALLLARKYRDKLIKTNQQITAQYMSKCAGYKSEMMSMMDEAEKEVREQVKQMQEAYEKREKELKKVLLTKYGKSQKKEHLDNVKEQLLKLS